LDTQPAHGTLSGTAPNLTFTPAANYNGPDSFTFTVNDGTATSAAATVSITVTAVNDAPVAASQSVTTAEDTAKAITLAGSDTDGDPLSYSVDTQPAHGTLSGTAPNLTFTPAANYNGPDSFTFKTNDGMADSNVATVNITVNAVNHPPVATNGSASTIEGIAVAITLSASDVDSDPLTYAVVSQPAHGIVSGSGASLTYSPTTDFTGSDSFTFKVNDGKVDSNTATVAVTVAVPQGLTGFLGDINGSGTVGIDDALQVLRFAVGLDQMTPEQKSHADVSPMVNGVPQPDGIIDIFDVIVILRKVVGLPY